MSITQHFDLNLIPESAPVVVHCDQYDTGTGRLVVSLYEGDTPYTPTGSAIIQGTKPDGHGFIYNASMSDNVVTANLTNQMSAVAGPVRCQIVVTESTGRTGTFAFILDVQASALPNDADMSESDYQLVETLLEEVETAASEIETSKQAAEDAAEDSEAWAVGTRGGDPVGPSDPTYHNNSKYWAEHGGGAGNGHTIVNADGQDMPQRGSLQFMSDVEDDAQRDMTIVKGAGGSTINVTTTETTLYGKNVTISDGNKTWTKAFSNTGAVSFTGIPSTGNLTITSTDGSETATSTLNIPYFGNYSVALTFFTATVTVSGGTGSLGGCTVKAVKGGVVVATGTLSNTPGQTSQYTFTFGEAGTYTFEVVNDWKTFTSDPVNVTQETSYSVTVNGFETDIILSTTTTAFKGQDVVVTSSGVPTKTITIDSTTGSVVYQALQAGTYTFTLTYMGEPYVATANVTVTDTTVSVVLNMWTATINISTTSSELYGQTITIKKGSTVVGTTAFSAQGSASYVVHETGEYTAECEGYSDSVTVSAETTYNITINAIETYNLTVTIFSAASDTVSYTDDDGAQTVTTDTTGKAENVSITITQPSIGVDPTITFTSSVAKDPTNLSNDYSKSVTLTSATTAIYVMPDNTYYWYGWINSIFEPMSTTNGWTFSGAGFSFVNPTFNTTSISWALTGGSSQYTGVGVNTEVTCKAIKAILTATAGFNGAYSLAPNKSVSSDGAAINGQLNNVTTGSKQLISFGDGVTSSTGYLKLYHVRGTANQSMNIEAIWTE